MTDGTSVVKCQNCGADLIYRPEKGTLYCEFCNSTKAVEKSNVQSRDFYLERSFGEVDNSMSLYRCPNCDGEVELQNFETASSCPFCGATNIIKKENLRGLKPDGILPFLLTKEKALTFGKKWLKKRHYAPHSLKKTFVADNFKGVYVPSFSFSTSTLSDYDGRLGERRTRMVGSGNNRHQQTYIQWYNVKGQIARNYQDLVVEASTQLNQKELQKIEPYDMQSIQGYKKEYLAGFVAEKYNASLDQSFGIAKTQMDTDIKKAIVSQYRADEVGHLNVRTTYNPVKFHYSLLPLWVCGYKYKDKLYRFVVNGRTGKSTGKTPTSPLRVLSTILFCLGIVALFVWLFVFSGIIQL